MLPTRIDSGGLPTQRSVDARGAIGILRAAARAAERESLDKIPRDVISEAVPETKSEIRQKSLDKLNSDQQTIYEIITDTGEIGSGELHNQYKDRAEDPKTRRMMRNYLSKMEHYNLVSANGATRGRTYALVRSDS